MTDVLIVGGGAIGSRHAQGVAACVAPVGRLIVVEPHEEARRTVVGRYEEVRQPGSPALTVVPSLEEVAGPVAVAVVATSSGPRAQVTLDLLAQCRPGAVVLEKVLFPALADYDIVPAALRSAGVAAFVNHPRRLGAGWRGVRDLLAASGGTLHKSGTGWGLACNAVHLLDLLRWADPAGTLEVEADGLAPGTVPAKRAGYLEVLGVLEARCGTVSGRFECTAPEPVHKALAVEAGPDRWEVVNGQDAFDLRNPRTGELRSFPPALPQSRLTGSVVDALVATGTCALPTLDHAVTTHRPFIQALLAHLPPEVVTGGRCPIT